MKESMILKLYNGEDPMCERLEPQNPEFAELFHQKEEKEEKIKASVDEKVAEMFEEYARISRRISSMVEEEAFRQGVCTGAKLMKEIVED